MRNLLLDPPFVDSPVGLSLLPISRRVAWSSAMSHLLSDCLIASGSLMCRCSFCAGASICVWTDFKDVFTPEAANATAYSNSVIGTNTWQWWNKERGEWAVYAIRVTAKQPSDELPPTAPIASPSPLPVARAPQPEQTDVNDATTAVSQVASAVELQAQPQPQAHTPLTQPQPEITSTAPSTDTADHGLPVKAPLTTEQPSAAVSPEEAAAAARPEQVTG